MPQSVAECPNRAVDGVMKAGFLWCGMVAKAWRPTAAFALESHTTRPTNHLFTPP
jgi:hypothetical protein